MGKLGKKIAKQQLEDKAKVENREIRDAKKNLAELMQEEKYDEALSVIAGLANLQGLDRAEADIMYDAAYCYFMTGDYERAATWINNTLTYEPVHKKARILLARLCILEDRTEDGLAIFDYVLEHWADGLTEAEKDELEEILEYYGRSEADKIKQHYPHVAVFLKLMTAEEAAAAKAAAAEAAPPAEGMDGVRETLAAIKQKAQDGVEDVQAAVGELTQKAAEQMPAIGEKLSEVKQQAAATATEAIAGVKEKAQETASGVQMTLAAMKQKLAALNEEKAAAASQPASEEKPAATLSEVEAKRDEILAQDASVAVKLRLMNSFAGAYFYDGDYQAAEVFLKAALGLDAYQTDTLRNMAVLAKAQGQAEAALAYAAKLPMMDFALLKLLRRQ